MTSFAAQIARVDAGATISCHAYEVDMLPATALIEIDAAVVVPIVGEV